MAVLDYTGMVCWSDSDGGQQLLTAGLSLSTCDMVLSKRYHGCPMTLGTTEDMDKLTPGGGWVYGWSLSRLLNMAGSIGATQEISRTLASNRHNYDAALYLDTAVRVLVANGNAVTSLNNFYTRR